MSAMEKHVREFVELISRGDYETVAKKSGGVRLSAEELREAVEEYGVELAPPGEGWWETVDVIPIEGSDPRSFAVTAPLWEPDGESDLTLELEVTEVEEGKFETEVDNLHVL